MACRHLIQSLAGHKVIIVSGLAVGIDGIAHQAALDAGLQTIAFPGSGLDWPVLYPSHNIGLAHNILKAGGALLSEFPCDLRGAYWTFPTRNRTMAGISHVTVVIEAEEKSGALITARHALEFCRETYAVPGSIFSYASAGTNKILGEWAHPITTVEQFIENMKIVPEEKD